MNGTKEAIAKADTLIEAMGWIRKFRGKTTVIKLGGSLMANPDAMQHTLLDIIFMETVGMRPVVVHGGGPSINKAMEVAAIEPVWVKGRRVTDARTLEIVERTLAYELNERLENAIRRRHRSGKRLAVLFLDIDHFKAINDTMGHAVGDAVLKEFAERLLLAVRETDTVSRLAGDEFVVILEGLNEATEADYVAQKIIDKVRHDWRIDNHQIALTTSIGVACGYAENLLPSELLALADAALYRAKAEGRDAFAVESC